MLQTATVNSINFICRPPVLFTKLGLLYNLTKRHSCNNRQRYEVKYYKTHNEHTKQDLEYKLF